MIVGNVFVVTESLPFPIARRRLLKVTNYFNIDDMQ